MSDPAKPSVEHSASEAQQIEPLLRRLDQPSDVSRSLLFCGSLASIGFVAAQNFDLMTTWQTVLNVLSGGAFALSLAVVFFQWDLREHIASGDAAASTGLRAYVAPIGRLGSVKFLRRQRFDRISFALIVLGVVLVFAAKIYRMSGQTNV
jgi:hypothetical protein